MEIIKKGLLSRKEEVCNICNTKFFYNKNDLLIDEKLVNRKGFKDSLYVSCPFCNNKIYL